MRRSSISALSATALLSIAGSSAQAATYYWDTTTTSTWQTGASWSTAPTSGGTTGTVPGAADSVVFNQSAVNGNETVNLGAPSAANGITFANTGSTLLQSSSGTQTLTIGSGGITVNAGAGAVTFGGTNTLNLALSASQSFTNNSASLLTIAKGVTSSAATGTQTLTVAGSGAGNTTFGGVVGNGATGGTLALVVNTTGAGITTLAGANTFTGGTTLQSGVLNVGVAQTSTTTGALGALSANSISFTGGTLQYSAANQYDYSAYFNSAAGQAVNIDTNGQSVIFASPLTSSGGTLTKLGAGTLTLAGANTYNGGTTLANGVLSLGAAQTSTTTGALGGLNANSISFTGGTLQYSAVNQYDYSAYFNNGAGQAISIDTNGQNVTLASALNSNGGTLTKLGAGTLDVTGNNSFTGGATVNTGTVSMGNASALGSGTIALAGGTLSADTDVALSNNFTNTGAGRSATVAGSHNISTSGNFTFYSTTGTPSAFYNNITGGAGFSVTGYTLLENNGGNQGQVLFGGAGNTSLEAIYGGPQGSTSTASLLDYYGSGTLTLNGPNNSPGLENFLGGTVVANEIGDGAGTTLGVTPDFLTLGSNLILSGPSGSNQTENLSGLAVAGSAQLSYQASISATPGSGNTINLGTFGTNSAASTINLQPGIAFTTTGSGTIGASASGFTSLYGGWAVSGYGLNSEDFAVNLSPNTTTNAAIVGLPTYLYALNGQNTQYVKLVANDAGGAQSDSSGNFNSVKFDTSNGTSAGTFTATKSNAFFDNDGGILDKSFNFLFTGFGNLTINGDAIVQNANTSANINGVLYLQQYGTGTVTIASNIYGTGSFTGSNVGGGASPVNGNVAGIAGGSTGTIVKSGPGTVVLTGANNYIGNTFINGGALSISSDSNLGGINGALTVVSGSATTSVVVTGELVYQDLIGASFLGSTITNQSGSTGSVTLTLAANGNGATGSNSFANGQQVIELNGGALQATNSFTLGETNGTVSNYRQITLGVNGGTIDVTGANTLTAPGIISQTIGGTGQLGGDTGVASLTKVNSGTLVLAGANTYLGGTYINGGTLKLDFSASGIANFTALAPTSNILAAGGSVFLGGGTLSITDATTAVVNTQTIASLGLIGGSNTVSMTHNSATSSTLTVTNGAINRTAGSTVDFISPASTSIVLTGNINNPFVGNYAFFGTGATEGYAATSSTGVVQAAATTAVASANSFASPTTNYAYASAGGTDTLTGNATANTAIFNTTAAQTIDLGASGTNTLTLNGFLNNGSALTIQRTGGTGSVIIGSSKELVIGGASNVTISSPISGAGSALTDSDSGTLSLSGANTYTGPTTVNTGTLALTGGSLTGSNIKTVGSAVVTQSSGNVIAGSGTTFTQASTGTSTLAGTNTFTGLTTVSGGELDLSNTTGQAIAGNVAVSGGTLKLTNSNQIATSGSLAVSGGTANVQTFSQTLAGVQLTGGTLTGTTGVLSSNSAFDIQAGVDSAILGGTAGLTKSTTGVALITSANTYTGTTTINGGAVYISALNNLGAATSAVVLGGGSLYYTGTAATDARGFVLSANSEIDSSATGTGLTIGTIGITGNTFTTTFGGTGNTTVTSNIATTTGGVTDTSFGTVTLSGANTYSGTTNLTNGTLNVGSGLALGTGGSIAFNGGTLQFSSLNSTDYSSRITNNTALSPIVIDTNSQTVTFASNLGSADLGGLSKLGLGDLILTGTNANAGSTFINGGLLTVGSSGALGSGTANITFFGGTLQYTAANTTDYSSRIKSSTSPISIDTNGQNVTFATALPNSNNAGLVKLGSGTLSLTAANLFTGTVNVSNGMLQVGNGTTGSVAAGDAVTFNSGTLNLKEAAGATQSLGALTFNSGDGVVQSTYAGSGTNTTTFASLGNRAVGATGNFVLSGGTAANNIINLPTIGTAGGGELGVGYFVGGSSYAVNGAAATLTNGAVTGPVRAINYGTDPGTLANNSATTSIANPTGSIAGATTTATTLTTTTTSGSAVIAVSSTTGLAVGNPVSGTGIPAGAVITVIGSGQVTISSNATANGTSAVFGTSNVVNTTTTGLVVGQYVSGTNIPANSYITAIGSGNITISQYATAAGTTALAYTTPFVQTTASVSAQASASMTDLNLSGTPNYTLASAATVKLDGILKSGGGASTISGGTGLTSLNVNDEIVIRTDTASDSLTISNNILMNGANAVTKSGAGTLTLSGANTYSGTTTIDGGTLVASTINGSGSNLGSGNLVVNGGGIFSYTGNTATTTRNVAFGSAGGEIDSTASGQTLTDSGTVTTLISSVGTFGGAGNITLGGVISGSGGITKNGAGTLTVSAANTYLGPTSVTGGNLALTSTGSIASGSPVTVGGFSGGTSIATISGAGFINGTLTTSSANANVAHIAAGVNTSGNFGVAGTLTVAGALTIGSGTNLDIDLNSATTVGGGVNDLINMTGTGAYGLLSIGGTVTVNVNALGTLTAGSASSNYYTLINGATSSSNLVASNFTTGAVTGTALAPHFFVSGNNLDVYFSASVNPTSYSLVTTAAGTGRVIVGQSIALTTTVTNTGTTGTDSLNVTNLGANAASGTVANATTSATNIAGNGTNGTASNTSQTYSSPTAGAVTVNPNTTTTTPALIATNTTLGTAATPGSATGASISVLNNRVITTPSVALGRYLVGSTVSGTSQLSSTTGDDASKTRLTLSGSGSVADGNGLALTAAGGTAVFNGSSANPSNSLRTISGTTSSAQAGTVSGSFNVGVTGEGLTGEADQTVTVAYTGDALNKRVITNGATTNLGLLHTGAAVSTASTAFTTSGTHLNTTDVSVAAGSGTVNGITFSGGPTSFAGTQSSDTRTLSGTIAQNTSNATAGVIGATTGTDSLGVTTLETGLGDTYGAVTVGYTAQVYSGQSTWATNGSGTWGSFSDNFGTNWGANQGSPGLDSAFVSSDTATFGTALAAGMSTAINTAHVTLDVTGNNPSLKAVTFNDTNAFTSYSIDPGTGGSLLLNGTGNVATSGLATVTNSNGANTISAPVGLTTSANVNVAQGTSLTFSGAVSGSGTGLNIGTGTGATILSNATGNSFTGPTAITAGKVYVSNTTGSGTGTGAVSVTGSTAQLGGTGKISGAITLSSGGSLYSGASSAGTETTAGTPGAGTLTGMTLSSALNVNGGNLTFALANTAGVAPVTAPNTSTSFLTTSSTVNFTGTDTITLVDLTNGGLTLRQNSAYELISDSLGDAGYSGLVINNNGALTLNNAANGYVNGYVVGVYVSGTNASNYVYNAITFNQFGSDGVTPLSTAGANGRDVSYLTPELYLNNGTLEVVPEPGTWALMIGGLALLVVIQRRRKSGPFSN